MQQIFAIQDTKAEAFLPPFYMRNKGEALRACETSVNEQGNKNNQIAAYPQDYVLCHLGSFDETTGIISATPPVIIETLSNLKH